MRLEEGALNNLVNFKDGSLSTVASDNTLGSLSHKACYNDFNAFYSYYPNYYPYYVEKKNSYESAFKIVGKLLEKKIIEKLTVKQFIDLVNELSKLL